MMSRSRGRPGKQIVLSDDDRKTLEGLVRAKKTELRLVLRARIILMAADDLSSKKIAKKLKISQQTVCQWRSRFAQAGIDDALNDKPRPGAPRRISEADRLELVALACKPLNDNKGRVTPTLKEIQKRAVVQGIKISESHLHYVLQSGDVHPHRVQQWLHSTDPQFREKVNKICELYKAAPADSVVLSIDEKSGMQAIERKYSGKPAKPGQLYREEYEYKRHGTLCLIGAYNVHTGEIIAECRKRRTQKDILEFMETVATAYPKQQVHVVWDNLNTHVSDKVWGAFNEKHGHRFHFHFTPKHASWVNQIELLFGIIGRRVLRNASHTSIEHLRECTQRFIKERNATPKPFKWTFRGFCLQTGELKRDKSKKKQKQPEV